MTSLMGTSIITARSLAVTNSVSFSTRLSAASASAASRSREWKASRFSLRHFTPFFWPLSLLIRRASFFYLLLYILFRCRGLLWSIAAVAVFAFLHCRGYVRWHCCCRHCCLRGSCYCLRGSVRAAAGWMSFQCRPFLCQCGCDVFALSGCSICTGACSSGSGGFCVTLIAAFFLCLSTRASRLVDCGKVNLSDYIKLGSWMRPRCCKYFGLFFFNLGFGQFFFLYGCHYWSLWFFLGFSFWCRCRFLFVWLSGACVSDSFLLAGVSTGFCSGCCSRRGSATGAGVVFFYCGSLWLHRSFDGFWRGCGLRYRSLLFCRCRFSLFSLRLCGCGFGLRFWLGFDSGLCSVLCRTGSPFESRSICPTTVGLTAGQF